MTERRALLIIRHLAASTAWILIGLGGILVLLPIVADPSVTAVIHALMAAMGGGILAIGLFFVYLVDRERGREVIEDHDPGRVG